MAQQSSPDALQEILPPIGTVAPTKNTRSPRQINDQQRADATARRKHSAAAVVEEAPLPASKAPGLPKAGDDYRNRYLDAIAPDTGITGRLIKFDVKVAKFLCHDDGTEISPDRGLVVLVDQTLVGRIKFGGKGEPPVRRMGYLYDGFVVPEPDELPDRDQSKWDIGLDGQPRDPWQHQMQLALEDRATGAAFTFATTNETGRRAVGYLLRHYDRLARSHPDQYPVIRLRATQAPVKEKRVGRINVPVFAVVGRAPKEGAAKPDTSLAADMDDEIPRFDR